LDELSRPKSEDKLAIPDYVIRKIEGKNTDKLAV